jgi:hypothetical protein
MATSLLSITRKPIPMTSAEKSWSRATASTRCRFTAFICQGVQMLDSENRDFPPIILEKDRNWRIVGKILWWIRKAP